MSYTLVIVESPAKCKKIEEYLGSDYKCIASFGHITELNGLQAIDISNNFSPTYSRDLKKLQQINKIKLAIKNCSEVLIATDDDREGEAIGWHLCKQFKLNVDTTKRIIFNEITQSAIQKAVLNPVTLNLDLIAAQQARQILDIIVGYKISPILWKYIKSENKQVLSAGRCQSPALKLVFDNQQEIENCPNSIVYNTTGYFTTKNIPFELNYNYLDEESMGNFLEQEANFDHIYTVSEPKNTTKNPPSPFITSTIQQSCSNELKISPKETMSICQKLYEGGYITYMRTDSKIYSKEFVEKSKIFIASEYGEEYIHSNIDMLSETGEVKKTKKNDKVKAQEAHEAIRPTNIDLQNLPDNTDNKEKKIYRLIWTNTVESCMSPAIYKSITASITASVVEYIYKYSTEQVVFPGWKMVNGYELVNSLYTYLVKIKNNSKIGYNKIISKVTMKETKQHYTEAKLVQMLEEKGIGRPSTFSSLIDKIQSRGYVKKENVKGKTISCTDFELIDDEISEINVEREFGNEKNKLVIQPIGVIVSEFLTKYYDELFKYEYTKYMEDILDSVAKGNTIWHELCRECYTQIETSSSHVDLTTRDNNDGQADETENKPINETKTLNKKLGKYNNENLVLKKGKYGLYVIWGENKKSLSGIDKDENEITFDDVITFINRPIININQYDNSNQNSANPNSNIVRYLNCELSIRKGKFGDYIFYKTKAMKTPKFFNLSKYKGNYKNDTNTELINWIKSTYEI
jgi:DNA topoisomerase-1